MVSAALDLLGEGLAIFDADLRLFACNRLFRELQDFPGSVMSPNTTLEEIIRDNAARGEYGPGSSEMHVADRIDAVRGSKAIQDEQHRSDGRILSVRGCPLPQRGFAVVYTDITEQRRLQEEVKRHNVRLEEHVRRRTAQLITANVELSASAAANRQTTLALRRSEARLREITDAIPAHIAYFDRTLTYRYTNRAYARWFGRQDGDLVGRKIVDILPAEVFTAVGEYLRLALSGQTVSYEYAINGSEGRKRHARSTLVPDIGADGETVGVYAHTVEVTEQHYAQEALVYAQKMETVGRLAGGLAHDFNNMLTVVIGNLLALREARLDDVSGEFIEPALQAADRCTELIRRLMTLSRRQPMMPQTIGIGALIQDMAQLFRRLLPETIAMTVTCADVMPVMIAGARQLEDALLNLVLNARDAMADGGELQIDCQSVAVGTDMAVELVVTAGDYVCISVRDTGIGMDEATLSRVCEPFFTTKGLGSGLGMSMVYGFTRQSGGAIRFASRPGKGTTVSLYLPCAAVGSTETVPVRASLPSPPDLTGHLVLLVEDDPDVRKVVRNQLASFGCLILEAENGHEAADLIENVPAISLLLSDIVMPGGMDGRALARFASAFRPDLKIILMTGYAESSEKERNDFSPPVLEKPFSKEKLIDILDRFFRNRHDDAEGPQRVRET